MAIQIQQNKNTPEKFFSGRSFIAFALLATLAACTTSQITDQTAGPAQIEPASQQDVAQKTAPAPAEQVASQQNNPINDAPTNVASLAAVESSSASGATSSDPLHPALDTPIAPAVDAPIQADTSYSGGQFWRDNRLASLQSGQEPIRSDANVMAYASLSLAEQEKERGAQQRIAAINSQMTHGACKNGWATPPDRLDAGRIVPGHPYYLEIRLRNTPLFPVGHTYIAYGRASASGEPLEEKLILLSPLGGYGGAAIAAAVPVPGVLTPFPDDCKIKPHAAYRVTLTAQKYEQLLLRIQKAQKKPPPYMLFAYNCNNFVADIVAPVGILPAENRFLPAVKYLYGLIEANEGKGWKKKQRS